jgi:hypothetical protein
VLAQVAARVDQLLERGGLVGGREGTAADGQRFEIHLRDVARNVDQVVARHRVAVGVTREHEARVAIGVAVVERRDRRPAEAEVLLRVVRRQEHPLAGELVE